jgi:metal-dependent amidase/aminoacylase/carboxypeptidase family protein
MTDEEKPTKILAYLDKMLPELEALYKDIHRHPELSMQETRTAGIAADHLRTSGFEVTTGVGKTGVVETGVKALVVAAHAWLAP